MDYEELYVKNLKIIKNAGRGTDIYRVVEKVALKLSRKNRSVSSNDNWFNAQEKIAIWSINPGPDRNKIDLGNGLEDCLRGYIKKWHIRKRENPDYAQEGNVYELAIESLAYEISN
jgi:hypothetical protein